MVSILNTFEVAVVPNGLQFFGDPSKLKTLDIGFDHNTRFFPDQSKFIGIIFAIASVPTSTIININ